MTDPKTSTVTHIHRFYRIWFTIVDPLVSLPSAYLSFFHRDAAANAYVDITIAPRDPRHDLLFYFSGGLMLLVTVLLAGLLRLRPHDLVVWKTVTFGILLVDIALLVGEWDILGKQGRLDPETWRVEEWGSWILTTWVTILRTAFLAGLGVSTVDREIKDKSA